MNEFRSQVFGQRKPLLGTKQPKRAKEQPGLANVVVRREETRTTDMRDDDRHRLVEHDAIAIHRRKRSQVELVNLSGGGAMVETSLKPRIGDRLDLELGEGARLEAVVRWVKNGRIGLEFAHETQIDCSPDQREKLFREIIERSFPDLALNVPADAPEPNKPAQAPEPETRRSKRRHPLIWSGVIRLYDREAMVRVRNISSHGALIHSDLTLTPGVSLQLELGGAGIVESKVSWAVGDQAGLSFESEFDILKLSLIRPSVVPFDWDAPTHLRTAAKPSPWDKAWKRMSVEDLARSLEGYLKR